MARLIVRHEVEDFDRWKRGYDENEALRSDHGVRHDAVFRGADDPRDVAVVHDFDSVEDARGFADDPRLREAMQELGVVGEPQLWIGEEAD